MSGSGGVIVMDDSVCVVRVLSRIARFYAEESCGQCTPCREGTPWMEAIVEKIEHGRATAEDVDKLEQVAGSILGMTICALGDAAAMPVQSFVRRFRQDFLAHVEARGCPVGADGWGALQETREAYIGPLQY